MHETEPIWRHSTFLGKRFGRPRGFTPRKSPVRDHGPFARFCPPATSRAICIRLRGPAFLGRNAEDIQAFSWGDSTQRTLVEDYLLRAVEQTRRTYHIHSERIYLAGFAEGAAIAYRLGLTFPDKLAGVISLNGAMP